ncbi:AsmA family protein [Aquisalimonas lutea]|uniref:AsmA family protein n=1 Tax=Aquisalimonas lutea TaxID=1327750 RepID=UPI0025B51C59|nr:AsmA family protein [Aquisalimonas lutea]MDN3519568.1 AsmA family protein [Aquisalimonas lutea]
MPTLLRRIALSLLAFLVLVGVLLVAAWWFVDPNDYRDAINRHASEALGHPVAVHGQIRLELLPRPAITLESATIANVDGYTDAPFAEASGLHAAIRPLPLFTGELELSAVEVDAISMRPERNAEGDANWVPIIDAVGARDDDPPLAFSGIHHTRIDAITVDYVDHQRETRYRFTASDIAVDHLSSGSSTTIDGRWQAHGAPFNRVDGDIAAHFDLDEALRPRAAEITHLRLEWTPDPDRPDTLAADASARLEFAPEDNAITLSHLTVSGDAFDAELQTDVTWEDDNQSASGSFTVTDAALRDRLHTLIGDDPNAEDPGALQRLHTEGTFQWQQQRLRLEAVRVELDDSKLEASIDARFGADPLWEFDAALDAIDVGRYTPEEFHPDAVRTITRFILDSVTGIDLDGTIMVDTLKATGLTFEALEATIRSQGDELTVLPLEASVYGGSYYGTFNVPLRATPYTVRFDQRIDGMALGEPLTALFGWAVLEAEVDAHWSGSFTGMHWPDIRESLEAEGTLTLRDGRINRFSLTRLIEDAVPRAMGGVDQAPFSRDATTSFDSIAGKLVMEGGVLKNPDAHADSDYFSVGGSGNLDLAELELDYQLDLTIVDAFETESEELLELLRGISIPLRLHGPLTDPDVQLDLEQALGSDGDADN